MKIIRSVPSAVLTPALRNVLESMYFCGVYPDGGRGFSNAGIGAVVRFSGMLQANSRALPVNGAFRILVAESVARTFAAELLPSDPAVVSAEQVRDTVCEFANVSCGAVLAAWMPRGEFDLAVPHQEVGSEGHLFDHWYRIDGIPGDAADAAPAPHLGVQLRIDGC